MTQLSIKVSRLPEIQLPLVNRFYKASRYSAKAGRGEAVFVARHLVASVSGASVEPSAGEIVAAVRLQLKSDGWWFLRSMCVKPELQGQGIGRQLLLGLNEFLSTRDCFCYPFDHLEGFYGVLDFEPVKDSNMALMPSFMREPYQRYTQQGRKIILMRKMVRSDS